MVEWRDVPGYEGLYQVSEFGDVLSLRKGILLSPDWAKGYKRVTLQNKGVRERITVHRLVAMVFLPPRKPTDVLVRHMDDNPVNNHYSNLRWGTVSENSIDSVVNGGHRNTRKTHCPSGHKYTPENTYVKSSGWRICIACDKLHCANFRLKRKAGQNG